MESNMSFVSAPAWYVCGILEQIEINPKQRLWLWRNGLAEKLPPVQNKQLTTPRRLLSRKK
jgi:hypothetical protein